MSPGLIGRIAGLLAIARIFPYLVSIFRGNTKPQRASLAIWSVVGTVTVINYLAVGATTTAIVPIVYAGSDLLYFGLSFKYGMGGFQKLDLICVGITLTAVVLWTTTNNPEIALYANLCAIGLGFIPVIKKAYTHPSTENTIAWCLSAAASVLTVAAVRSWTTTIAALPIVNLVGIGTVAILLIVPREPLPIPVVISS